MLILSAPVIHIAILPTSLTFRFSDGDIAEPSIIVRSTLITPATLTVDARGGRTAHTVLGPSSTADLDFCVENFAFYGIATSESFAHNLYSGLCEPGKQLVELHRLEPHVTRALLHENDPSADPVNVIEPAMYIA